MTNKHKDLELSRHFDRDLTGEVLSRKQADKHKNKPRADNVKVRTTFQRGNTSTLPHSWTSTYTTAEKLQQLLQVHYSSSSKTVRV